MSTKAPIRSTRLRQTAGPRVVFLIAVSLVAAARPVSAQISAGPAESGYKVEPGTPSSAVPDVLREVGFDQNMGQQVPLDASFTDDQGRAVRLGDYFGARPAVLVMAYYNCPMLCTQVLNGLAASLSVLSLDAGKDYDVIVVSIDPREKPPLAAEKKAVFLERYRRPATAPAIHFLTGEQPAISRVAKAVGFRYVWDDSLKQFAHPTGIVVVTPQGRIARYLFGVEYGPRDLRLALVEASAGKIGTPVDELLLYCYHYDPQTGKYGFEVMAIVRIAGAATALAIGAFVFIMIRREKRSGPRASGV
jgi:protein SCO1